MTMAQSPVPELKDGSPHSSVHPQGKGASHFCVNQTPQITLVFTSLLLQVKEGVLWQLSWLLLGPLVREWLPDHATVHGLW